MLLKRFIDDVDGINTFTFYENDKVISTKKLFVYNFYRLIN